MNKYLTIAQTPVELIDVEQHSVLSQFYQTHANKEVSDTTGIAALLNNSHIKIRPLTDTDNGLSLTWCRADQIPLNYYLDFVKTACQLRSFPAAKQGAFNQALGKKTKRIVDATGGWGGDALLMCLQGYQVTVIERNPIMALLLTDAFHRLASSHWAEDNTVNIPQVINASAIDFFHQFEQQSSKQVDCIYLDPMFPPKRKKSAAVNKQMQFLQQLVGEDLDAQDTLSVALENGFSRIAVKRPHHAEPLLRAPNSQFSSKLVHYDVYH